MTEFSKLINIKTKESNLKKAPGIISSYDSETGYARVRLPTANNIVHSFINKSGEELAQGDSVQIWYFTDISAGFIGLRCGNPSAPTGSIKARILIKSDFEKIEKKDENTVYYVIQPNKTVKEYLGATEISGGGETTFIATAADATLFSEKSEGEIVGVATKTDL